MPGKIGQRLRDSLCFVELDLLTSIPLRRFMMEAFAEAFPTKQSKKGANVRKAFAM